MTKFLNTNRHRILVVNDGERHNVAGGAEVDATGELAKAFEGTNGVVKSSSKDADAYRSQNEIERVAGSGSEAQAVANAFDPGELDADQAITAFERVTDGDVLAASLASERSGKDRKSVVKAAEDRADTLGIDLDAKYELAVKQAAAQDNLESVTSNEDTGVGGGGTLTSVGPSAENDSPEPEVAQAPPVGGGEGDQAQGSAGTVTSDKVATKGKTSTGKRTAAATKPSSSSKSSSRKK